MSTQTPWEGNEERNAEAEKRKQARQAKADAGDPDRSSPEEEADTSDDEGPG